MEKQKRRRVERQLQRLDRERVHFSENARPDRELSGSHPFHRLLVFEHIPKTGGTTFRRSYLKAALPSHERWILSGGEDNERDRQRFLAFASEHRSRLGIRVVAGHMAESLRPHLPGARYISVVRDPVDRAISSYLHAMFHPGEEPVSATVRAAQPTLSEYVEQYQAPSEQSQILLGTDYASYDDQQIRKHLNERYTIVGYTEALEDFLFYLHVTEQLPLCLFNNRLVRAERATYVPDPADLAFVRRHHADDVRLHAIVKEEFDRRVSALPGAVVEQMRRYREALAAFHVESGGDVNRFVRLDGM